VFPAPASPLSYDAAMNDELLRTFAAVPTNQAFGFELSAVGEGSAEVRMPVQEWFAQEAGIVHGGIVSALADTAAAYAIIPSLKEGTSMVGIELKVNFLRASRMTDGPLLARARAVRHGGRVAVCSVDVMQGSEQTATGLFTYLILKR
jgi:uncharacterized protein (TIGR00369 family)